MIYLIVASCVVLCVSACSRQPVSRIESPDSGRRAERTDARAGEAKNAMGGDRAEANSNALSCGEADLNMVTALYAASTRFTPPVGIHIDKATRDALSLAECLLTNSTKTALEKLDAIDAYSLGVLQGNTNAAFYIKLYNYWPYAALPMLYIVLEDIAENTSNDPSVRSYAYQKMSIIDMSVYCEEDAIQMAERAASLSRSIQSADDESLSYYLIAQAYGRVGGDEEKCSSFLRKAESLAVPGRMMDSIRSSLAASLIYQSRRDQAERVISRMSDAQQQQMRNGVVYKLMSNGQSVERARDLWPASGVGQLLEPGTDLDESYRNNPSAFEARVSSAFRAKIKTKMELWHVNRK